MRHYSPEFLTVLQIKYFGYFMRRSLLPNAIFLTVFLILSCPATLRAVEEDNRPLTELTLEELMDKQVYSASKFDQKSSQAPSSVSVISSDEIDLYGYRTLADILQSVQGLHVSYDRNYAFLGTRGINLGDFNSRVLVLVDGHQINNNLTDGALIGTAFPLDVDLIERVEIIRGPGSVLYGNNAFFGVINVITKKVGQIGPAEVSGEYGTFDTYKGRVTLGHSFTNGVEVLLSGTLYDSEGNDRLFYKEFNTPDQNRGVARGIDDDSLKNFFGTLSYRDFTLQGSFITRKKNNPTAQFLTTFNDPALRTIDDRSYADLKYAHDFEDVGEVTARVHYDRSDYEIGYPTTGALYTEEQSGEWWGTEVQFNRRLWDRHVLTVGAEYRDDFHQSQRTFNDQTGEVISDQGRTRESHGVFIQGDFAVVTNLHLNAGVRYDKYGDFDDTINPRLALIYNPFEKSTFKAIYGTAFRAPNFLELSDPRFQDIGAEKITSYELVYEQGWGKYLRSSASAFYNEIDELISFQEGHFTNFNAQAHGLEFALEGIWPGGIRSRASYTFQETSNRDTDRTLTDSPKHLGKLNVSVPLFKEKVFASLEFLYVSSRKSARLGDDGNTLVSGQDAPAYGVANFTLFSQNLIENLELSASIYNLLDRKYSDPATRFHRQDLIEQNGRTFRVKATYRF